MWRRSSFVVLALVVLLTLVRSPCAAQLCTSDDDCDGSDACIGGACVPLVPDVDLYAQQAALRWSSDWWLVQYPQLYDPPEDCCVDLTGNGQPDDAFGELQALMAFTVGVPALAVLDEVALWIQAGEVVNVMDWRELAPDLGTGDVQVSLFDGELASGVTFVDRQAGLGHLDLHYTSFGPYGALSQLNDGTVSAGTLEVTGNWVEVPLIALPVPEVLTARLERPVLTALVAYDDSPGAVCHGLCTVDEDRTGTQVPPLTGGATLGGAISAADLFASIDAYYRPCSCAGIDPALPVLHWQVSAGRTVASCTPNVGDWTPCGPPCDSLGWLCILIEYYDDAEDLDLDQDLVLDAFSAGFRVAWAGTAIDGVTAGIFDHGFDGGNLLGWSAVEP